ncbi:glycosyltransferase family 4 protein [Flavobacterium sp. U410]
MKLLYLGNKLSKHGLNATTVETLGKAFQSEGYDVVSVSEKKSFLFRILDMALACLFQRNMAFVLIDTYSTKAFWYTVICSQICRLRNLRYIPILHGGNLPERLVKNPKLCRLVFSHAYRNAAPSNYLKNSFEEAGFTNVLYIPNSIEIDKYSFKKRTVFHPKLLWVRAFAEIYNPQMAVSVLHKISAVYPDALLTMVGPDKEGIQHEVERLAKDLNVKVQFTGKLTKEEWWKLSEDYDFFINTTHFDNTPVSVMEAMALGLCVVSTNVGGLPYLLEHERDSILVPDNEINEMAEKIVALMQKPFEAEQLTLNARSKAEQWDWRIIKEAWNRLFSL